MKAERMGSDVHQRGIEGVDLWCGLKRRGVHVPRSYGWKFKIKTKPLNCSRASSRWLTYPSPVYHTGESDWHCPQSNTHVREGQVPVT